MASVQKDQDGDVIMTQAPLYPNQNQAAIQEPSISPNVSSDQSRRVATANVQVQPGLFGQSYRVP